MHALIVLSLLAAPCPTRPSWPTESWPSENLEQVKLDRATEIQALEDYAFTLTGTDGERLGLRTESLLIIKGGELIYERYARGFGPTNRHLSWSVAKSVTTALTGVAVQLGALKTSDSVCDYVDARTELCPITVQHLMEFGSGMHWQEGYEHGSYQRSSVIAMLLGEGHRDMPGFVLGHQKQAEPGTRFNYSTGEAGLLSEVVRQAGLKHGLTADWFWSELFDRVGMSGVVFSGDPKGAPGGGSYVFATPRDFARFGYLYLNDGCWNGQRLLPEDWVTRSTTQSATFKAGAAETDDTSNGWMWWLNDVVEKKGERPWKDAPTDAYSAIGHWGQFVVVVPSRDVVIVRTGDDRNDGVDLNQLIPLALEVAR
ncbi:MAG: serine hydrolase [Archangiaceae bacterium]|nr:serine hydrolase [Archangiaceae bacterium]